MRCDVMCRKVVFKVVRKVGATEFSPPFSSSRRARTHNDAQVTAARHRRVIVAEALTHHFGRCEMSSERTTSELPHLLLTLVRSAARAHKKVWGSFARARARRRLREPPPPTLLALALLSLGALWVMGGLVGGIFCG